MTPKFKAELRSLRYSLYHRLAFSPKSEREITDAFHKIYYGAGERGKTWRATYWMGAKVGKCPLDLWLYQDLIYRLKPDLIIETGTYFGGGAYYFATLCDLIGKGRVISIDIESVEALEKRETDRPEKIRPVHPRIEYWHASSTAPETLARLQNYVAACPNVLVSLDSDHRKDHVLSELRLYSRLIPVGSYIVVEDTDINGHPVFPGYGPGPWEAVEQFLKENSSFEVDEPLNTTHLMSMHPRGYLKRIK